MRRVIRWGLVALALALSFELGLRARTMIKDPHRFGPQGFFSYRPHTQVGDTPDLTTNNYGFFGPELALPKPENTLRVFLVGSSVLANPDLPKATAAALEEALPGKRIEICTTGIPRYCSYHCTLLTERRLIELEPDVLVIYLGLNDNVYNTNPGIDAAPPVGLWNPARLDYSLAGAMARYYVWYKRFVVTPDFTDIRSAPIFERHLRGIIETARANGIRVLFVRMALAYETEDLDLAQQIAANEGPMAHFWGTTEASKRGVEAHNDVLDYMAAEYGTPLTDANAEIPKTSVYFRDLCHLTPEGNAALGKIFARAVAGQ